MDIDEGKELAIKLCKEHKSSFELVAGRSQARSVTAVRRKVVLALYAKDLREWQIAKILNKHKSTIWAYRHLDEKKGKSSEYKRRNQRNKAKGPLPGLNHRGPGRDTGKRQPSKGLGADKAVGRVSSKK